MPDRDRPACLLCSGPMILRYELPRIWHQPAGTNRYAVCWCDNCEFGLLLPRPSQKDLDTFYDEQYFARYARQSKDRYQGQTDHTPDCPTFLDRIRVHAAWRFDRGRELDARSLSAVVGPPPLSVCDIGCGIGGMLADLNAMGYQTVGVEADPAALQMTASKGIDVFSGYAEALPEQVNRQSFDVVSMVHVLEHCLNPVEALKNAAALLRPGGYLVVGVPNNESISGQRSGVAWFHCDAGRHVNFFTAKSLVKAMQSLDLEVVERFFGIYVAAFLNERVAAEGVPWDHLFAGEECALRRKNRTELKAAAMGHFGTELVCIAAQEIRDRHDHCQTPKVASARENQGIDSRDHFADRTRRLSYSVNVGLNYQAWNTFMKRALITGITGQDGSYLAEYLLSKPEYEVHGLVRRSSSLNRQRIDHVFARDPSIRDRFYLHYADLADASSLALVMEQVRPDEVYNLGAQSHVRVSFDQPLYTADVVGLGTLRLLEAVRQLNRSKPVRFYQASSSEMFGAAPPPQGLDTPFHPRSPYACAKVYAHWQTINYREAYGLYACSGVLFNHESPRRGESFVTRKVTLGATRIKEGLQKKLIMGNLEAKRDWGFAGDYVARCG